MWIVSDNLLRISILNKYIPKKIIKIIFILIIKLPKIIETGKKLINKFNKFVLRGLFLICINKNK